MPLPPPQGWPATPPEPEGLDGIVADRPYVEVADRSYDRTTCPTCSVELDPLPKAKKRCRACGEEIFVRSGPDSRRYLLASTELEAFEQRWADDSIARGDDARAQQILADAEWLNRLRAAGVAVGDDDLDVVGESFYHAALAGIRASHVAPDSPIFEIRTLANLVREPSNQYDRNAIGVFIHGVKVGHLDRYDAQDRQALLKRRGGQMLVQAIVMGGRVTAGEVGPIGVRLASIPGASA